MPVTVGLKSRAEVLVNGSNTANAVGSGLVPVFSTPSMIALMENAAVRTIQGRLEQGKPPWAPIWTLPTTPPPRWA